MTAARRRRVFVSAGSNVQPERHLRVALHGLRARFGTVDVSSVYRNRAEGFEGEDFLNLVVAFSTKESAEAVVGELERLHRDAGRVRGPDPFASRTLDLDLLLYGDEVRPELKIPRPDITQYSFVLGPLAEIAPDLPHPLTGVTMAELWRDFDKSLHPLTRLPSGSLDGD